MSFMRSNMTTQWRRSVTILVQFSYYHNSVNFENVRTVCGPYLDLMDLKIQSWSNSNFKANLHSRSSCMRYQRRQIQRSFILERRERIGCAMAALLKFTCKYHRTHETCQVEIHLKGCKWASRPNMHIIIAVVIHFGKIVRIMK